MKIASYTLLLAVCVSAQAAAPRIYRIDEHVYRGKQPNSAEFLELAKMGIHTVLDLRGGMIHKPHERRLAEAAGMQYISVRLSGIFAPKDRQIAEILTVLDNPARWPVFVHCRRGDNRLGMAIACYRMAHDHWTNQQAFDEARSFGISRFEVLMRRYILRFDPARLQQSRGHARARSRDRSVAAGSDSY